MRFYLPVLFFVMTVGFFGCHEKAGKKGNNTTKDTVTVDLDSILRRGYLNALVDNGSSSYFVYKGQPLGFEYEMLEWFAEHLNLELRIQLVNDIDSFFTKLNRLEGDIMAANITVTKDRMDIVDFSVPVLKTRQVLIQRLPKGFRRMNSGQLKDSLITDINELDGKTVHVRSTSSFYNRLRNIEDEIGGDIELVDLKDELSDTNSLSTELLIRMVSEGRIDYTVADENVALLNKRYYDNLDVSLPISFEQKIAWAVRKNSPNLLDTLNRWLRKFKRTNDYHTIRTKYFSARTAHSRKVLSDYSSLQGGISEYDEIIQKYAKEIAWDWRLLAAMIYRESQFDPQATSWTGAKGLMQLIPTTAASFGVDSSNIYNPSANIAAGTGYLDWIENYWSKAISDSLERRKFVLASYNVGLGHVIDARNLAAKYGQDENTWEDNVAYFLLHKSDKEYYTDPVVKHGYCRGSEPFNYVNDVLSFYQHYKNHVGEQL